MNRLAKAAAASLTAPIFLLVSYSCGLRPASAQTNEAAAEKLLFDSANRERAALGIGLLKWDEALARAARQHALRMAEQHALSHQFPGEPDLLSRIRQAGARFVALAENVAEGPGVAGLHGQWMKSPPHRENLLDPQMNALGVAVELRGGMFFAVEDFSQAIAALALGEQQREVAAQLRSRGLHILANDGNDGDASKFCMAYGGDAQRAVPKLRDHPAAFALRYSTSDIASLPGALTHELETGRYHAAAVAACELPRQADFSGYQLAVLLYR